MWIHLRQVDPLTSPGSVASPDRGPCSPRDKITRCEESSRNPPLSLDNQRPGQLFPVWLLQLLHTFQSAVSFRRWDLFFHFASAVHSIGLDGGCLGSPDNGIGLIYVRRNQLCNKPNSVNKIS
jgi:hypothetical protein